MKMVRYALLLLVSSMAFAQTTIVSDGLNNSSSLFTISGGAYYTGSSASGDRPASTAFTYEGTHAYGISNGTVTLTSGDINTIGYSNIQISLRLASFSIGSTGNGADGGDSVVISVSPDGGTNYYSTLKVAGNANAYWSHTSGTGIATTAYDGNTTVVSMAPAAGASRTTDGYSTMAVTGLPAATNVRIKITMINNSANERWLVDSVMVSGSGAATEPTTQSSAVNFTTIGATQFTVNWTNGNGGARVVLMKSGSAVDGSPADNTGYTANATFGSGTEIGTGNYVVFSGSGNNVTVSGLTASTTYHVSVFEYNGSGSGANYLLTSPATGSQSTSAAVSSASDLVTANNETSNIDYASNQSANMTATTDGVRVWSFTIRDGGGSADADAFGTELNSITIGKGGSNTVTSWTNTVRRAALYDGSTEIAEVDVTGETISFTGLSGSNVTVADDGSKSLDLYFTFETGVTDNQQFHFLVTAATENPAMSQFAAADAGAATSSVTGDANKIEVTATKIVFTSVPGQVELNAPFTVAIAAQDGNNILDADAATSVTLSRAAGTGTLSSVTGLTQSLASGVYTWSDPKLNVAESGVTLQTANTGGLTNATSSSFNVVVGDILLVENFDYTASTDLTANGWTGHSGTATPPVVSASGLSYTGYSGSGTGKAADVFGTDQDVNRSFTTQKLNGSSVYLSALVKVSEATASQTGTYFMHLGSRDPNTPTTFTNFCARIFARVVSDSVNFGLSSGSSTATWAATNYAKNATILLVAKYTINTSGSDVAKLWVITSGLPASETEAGTAAVTITDAAQDSVNAIALRQATNLPDIVVDGIRIATSWGTAPLPVELTSFTAVAKGRGVELAWSTATEQDNLGFEVERKSGGEWTRLGFVKGAGTTNAPQSYTFTDASAKGSVSYRLKQIDRDGGFEYTGQVEVFVEQIVTTYALTQNYPNPFNPSTTIQYQIPVSGNVSLKVYDMLGKEVAAPVNGFHPAGVHAVSFDASQLSSGIYFYQLRSGSFLQTRRMQLLK